MTIRQSHKYTTLVFRLDPTSVYGSASYKTNLWVNYSTCNTKLQVDLALSRL